MSKNLIIIENGDSMKTLLHGLSTRKIKITKILMTWLNMVDYG